MNILYQERRTKIDKVLEYSLPGEDKDGDSVRLIWRGQGWRHCKNSLYLLKGQRWRQQCYHILYLQRTKIDSVLEYSLPGEDKDGDRVANKAQDSNNVEQDPGDPKLENGVVHLVRRGVLKKG